ncbi:MAG: PIG-L deacetylase family protein [Candidatus Latescibacterota bacterium]
MKDPKLPDSLQILTIVAHPHDVTYTLGTSAHHIQRGDRVTAVSLTDGVTTHDEELENELRKPEYERRTEILLRPRDQQARRKQREMGRVCHLFGITDVRVLPFPDNPIEATPELNRTLADVFYEIRPDIVITHAPFDYPHHNTTSLWGHDHPATGQSVWQAMQRVSQADAQHKRAPHKVAQVYYIGVEFGWTDIDLFVDISDQIASRIAAEALYETQGHTSQFARKHVEAFAGSAGWWGRTGYAEPFIRAKAETSEYLTVSPIDLRTARETVQKNLQRMGQFASAQPGETGDQS